MEGWLTKRRDHINFIWRNRYFILDGNQLRYYNKRGNPTPNGTFVLTRDCKVGNVFNSEEKHKHHDAVWMFRLTFEVADGEKSYKKDRFVDLGAPTEENANEWRNELVRTIESVKLTAEQRGNILRKSSAIGATPAVLQKFLKSDDEAVSLFDVTNQKDTTGTGGGDGADGDGCSVTIKNGLRVIQEIPKGVVDNTAQRHNDLLLCSIGSSSLAFIITSMVLRQCVVVSLIASTVATVATFFLFGIHCKSSSEVALFRVTQVVNATPVEVFRLLMITSHYCEWDGATATARVVQTMDDHADILYITLAPVFIWPVWTKARDLVVMRYWRREEDGSYFVMFQSTTHPEYRERHDYIRAHYSGGFVIAPEKVVSRGGELKSLVTNALRYDPRGLCHILTNFAGRGLDPAMPLLARVLGIRDELNAQHFIKPNVSQSEVEVDDTVSHKTSSSSTRHIMSGTSVDTESGLVVGVPKVPCNFASSMWAEPDASKFQVRGPKYLDDRKKVASGPSGFHLVAVDFFSFEKNGDQYNIGSLPESAVHKTSEFTIIISMIIPGPENTALVFYFQPSRPNLLDESTAFAELLNDFFDGDDAFRNSRFKLIPTVVEGTFIIKQSVGSKPALIGNKLKCPYYKGDNYFEIDIDIGSNSVANTVVGMAKGVTKSLVVDLAFLIESQGEEELPENVLGTVRLQQISLDNPVRVSSR